MDKITLNKEQLLAIKSFIETNIYNDKVVVLELVDHLACKVEEILSEQPDLSFENAMFVAVESFGSGGLDALADAYVASLKEKYGKIYKNELRKLSRSFSFVITLLLASIMLYHILEWARIYNVYLLSIIPIGLFICIEAIWGIYFACRYPIKKNIAFRKNVIIHAANSTRFRLSKSMSAYSLLGFMLIIMHNPLVLTMSFFFTIWIRCAMNTMVQRAYEEYSYTDNQYKAFN